MNVLFDISLLGAWHRKPRQRTGVFRVVEELALGLLASDECTLEFCASHSLIDTLDYLANHPTLCRARVAHTPFQSWLARINGPLRTFITRSIEDRRLSARISRRLVAQISKLATLPLRQLPTATLHRADIYHTQLPISPRFAGSGPRPARFITVYDLIAQLFPHFYEPEQARSIQRLYADIDPSHWIIAISEATRRDLIANTRCDPTKVFVVPLAAGSHFYPCHDVERIATVRAIHGIPPGPYLLSLSTLEPRKNLEFVVHAFSRLLREARGQLDSDLRLVLIGSKGWKFDPLIKMIEDDLTLRERIILTGYVPDHELAALYSGAHAFVYMSHYEGFGLPPLEAMQCGVPVITSNTSSLPEVVGDGGRMLNPHDQDGFCQAVYDLLTDESQRQKWAQQALAHAGQFSWTITVERTLAAYRAAMS